VWCDRKSHDGLGHNHEMEIHLTTAKLTAIIAKHIQTLLCSILISWSTLCTIAARLLFRVGLIPRLERLLASAERR
jgi:hypothetical protein